MNGFLHQFVVNFEIPVGDAVAHGVHECPGDIKVLSSKGGIMDFNVVSGLAQYLNVADDGILGFLILKKSLRR
jgi:hypothetical protein